MASRHHYTPPLPPPIEIWDGVVSGAVQGTFHHEGSAAYGKIITWMRETSAKAGPVDMQNSLHFVITRSAIVGR